MLESLRAEIVKEIDQLTIGELRARLISAEHLIYVLEAVLKQTTGVHGGVDLLYANDMHRLVEDEKEARAHYAAAREEKTERPISPDYAAREG